MADRSAMPSERARNERRTPSRVTLVLATACVLALVAVGGLLLVTQIPKWSCDPPDHLWVEAPDHCLELP
jgi:hypothetical protein